MSNNITFAIALIYSFLSLRSYELPAGFCFIYRFPRVKLRFPEPHGHLIRLHHVYNCDITGFSGEGRPPIIRKLEFKTLDSYKEYLSVKSDNHVSKVNARLSIPYDMLTLCHINIKSLCTQTIIIQTVVTRFIEF